MHPLQEFIGHEHESDRLNRSLRDYAASQRAGLVGAMLVTCADESEREAADSFQHWFGDNLLPELKSWHRAPFRLANLGARYEWGAIHFAEQHFAASATQVPFKILLAKLNSHVAVEEHYGQTRFGAMRRYGSPSPCCGALAGLIQGARGPVFSDLQEAFSSEGMPRLEMLGDAEKIDPSHRPLLAAVVNARLQARRAIVDAQNYRPQTPTLYIVVACVTLNRAQRDGELVVGVYLADTRHAPIPTKYCGLEDDPTKLRVSLTHGRVHVADQHALLPREARNHREEIFNVWMRRAQLEPIPRDPRIQQLADHVAQQRHRDPRFARELLKTLSWLLLEASPIPATLLLFANGVAAAHHLYTVHRLARGHQDASGAKAIMDEFMANLDTLPHDQVQSLIEKLTEHYAGCHRRG